MKGPVYIVKPKYIFKHPFQKYDLSHPTNRQTQNQQLTDYFNYGFNEDTMHIYTKLVKRMLQVLDHRKNLQYFNEPSELMRLNDEIPMDFGGFCKFHDTSLLSNDSHENFHTGDSLIEYFIFLIITKKPQSPLIEFIRKMYKDQTEENDLLNEIVEKIGQNIDQKYQRTMVKLLEQKAEPKVVPNQKKNNHVQRKNNNLAQKKEEKQQSESEQEKEIEDSPSESKHKKHEKKRKSERRQKKSKDKHDRHKKSKKSKKVKKQKQKQKSKHKRKHRSRSHEKRKKNH